MNVQQYANILSRFNRVPSAEPTSQNVVVIRWTELKWENSLVGRLQFFDKILHHGRDVDARPFVRALGVFYRTDCVVTTFLSSRRNRLLQQTVLMGNERMLIPATEKTSKDGGNVYLCIFPFFVRDPDATFGGLKSCEEGVYPYRDGVLFADPYQIPFPGGSYHDAENARAEHGRVCFLTRHADAVPDVYSDWYGRRGVSLFPFQTRVAALRLISDFFPLPTPVSDVCFSNVHLKSSGTLQKRLSQYDPHYLLQDVLNTYASIHSDRANPLDNVALLVEYPFLTGFENSCGDGAVPSGCGSGNLLGVVATADSTSSPSVEAAASRFERRPARYVPFLVNGLNPKTILQVRHPYDRYVEYQKIDSLRIAKSDWIVFLYERFHGELLPSDVRLVCVGNTVLGYRYRDAFLCLSHPMLLDSPRTDDHDDGEDRSETDRKKKEQEEEEEEEEPSCRRPFSPPNVRNSVNLNTDVLLNPVERFNPKKDPRLVVFGTYGYDDVYDVYQVKHKRLRNELWCLVDKNKIEDLEHSSRPSAPECERTPKETTTRRTGTFRSGTATIGEENAEDRESEKRSSVVVDGKPKYFRKAAAPLTRFAHEWINFFYENADRKWVSYGNMDVFRLAMVLARHRICLKFNLSPSGNRTRRLQIRGREYVFGLDGPAIDFINDMRLSTIATTAEEKEEVGQKEERYCVVS